MTHQSFILAVFTITLSVQINAVFFGSKKVCYENIGCFDTAPPFNNAWKYLPESPEKVDVTFRLFNRDSPENPKYLDPNNPGSVSEADFDAEKPLKFIIHGYVDHGDAPWVLNMSRMFIKKEDCNVIAVDWHQGARTFYPQAVANTRLTAAITANLIRLLSDQFGLAKSSVHLIGHSLGSHICGYIGRRVAGLGRISGLDPAGPLFENTDLAVRLDPSDAIFVDVLHSDAIPLIDLGFGTLQELGHVDFYPNGGTQQPGCPNRPFFLGIKQVFTLDFKDVVHTLDCSHNRALYLYTDTIVSEECQFKGYPCASKDDFDKGKCSSCPEGGCPLMGYNADKVPVKTGKYYLKTTAQAPFCLR